jgi:hypothetical protein
MNALTIWPRISLPMFLTLFALSLQAAGEGGASTNASPHRTEDLGYYVENGQSNKIVRIFKVTPAHVQVILEGGQSAREIPRQDLPEQLKTRFPYDSTKAAAYQQQQIVDAAAREAARAAAVRAASLKREQEITAEIARLQEADKQLQSSTRVDRNLPHGNERRTRITDQTNQRQQIRARINELEGQLKILREQRDRLP